jgi:hypothetical protein
VTRRRVAVVCAGITVLVLLSPAANADPSDDCDTSTHDPQQWNGPLLPTWDTPHSNEGWTTLPQLCDPVTYLCSGMVGSRGQVTGRPARRTSAAFPVWWRSAATRSRHRRLAWPAAQPWG